MDQGLEKHVDGLCPASERGHDARLLATAGGAQPKKKRWRESRSKYEMTMELKERGITLPKSSTKEVSHTSQRLAVSSARHQKGFFVVSLRHDRKSWSLAG